MTLESLSASIRITEAALADLRAERVRQINQALDSGETWDRVQERAGVSRATVMAARRAGRATANG